MSRASGKASDDLQLGGVPRVDLLPQEVRDRAAVRRVRGRAIVGVVLVGALVTAGVGYAAYANFTATTALADARKRGDDLLLKQQEFAEVRQVEQSITAAQDAQRVGGWTEIDWKSYLGLVQATLPAGASLTSIAVDSATPITAYPQSSVPLQAARMATIKLEVHVPDIPTGDAWFANVRALPGFADATPGSVTRNEAGDYTIAAELHVGEQAFSNRFIPKVEPEPADADDEATDAAPDDSSDTTATGADQ